MTEPKLRSHWRVEIPQRRPKDSAQVHQTLFLLEGGVWGRDYVQARTRVVQCHSLTFIPKSTRAAAEDDFHEVYCELENIKARYYQLGIVLGLPLGKLEAIRKTHSQDVEQALTQVLLLWLKQQYNVEKFGCPTWQRLREAVDSPSGGENPALAERIAKKYLTSSI